jgi:hypothetical protein
MQALALNCAPGWASDETHERRSPDTGIPEGFIALGAVKTLPLMGRWNALPDGMPPWLPFHGLVEMARRDQAGDADAHEWLELFRSATQGEPGAQRLMGDACEHGRYGLQADVQRAFFWFYRAGLAGDEEASENALRLKDAHEISSAAMEEPALVYPGQWRISRDDAHGDTTTAIVELGEDGRISSRSLNGLWSYDRVRATVTFAHRETWRVRLLGCRDSVLFGRQAPGLAYTLERMAPCRPR